jgi:hypothetical protein
MEDRKIGRRRSSGSGNVLWEARRKFLRECRKTNLPLAVVTRANEGEEKCSVRKFNLIFVLPCRIIKKCTNFRHCSTRNDKL